MTKAGNVEPIVGRSNYQQLVHTYLYYHLPLLHFYYMERNFVCDITFVEKKFSGMRFSDFGDICTLNVVIS
jgi:hypothetical protein